MVCLNTTVNDIQRKKAIIFNNCIPAYNAAYTNVQMKVTPFFKKDSKNDLSVYILANYYNTFI